MGREVSKTIGLSGDYLEPDKFPLLGEVFKTVPAGHDAILTDNDLKFTRVLTDESLQAAYSKARAAKTKKLAEESDGPIPIAELKQKAEAKAREVEGSTFKDRLARSERYCQQLQLQSLLLEKLRQSIIQDRGAVFELTSQDVDAIRATIIPSYVEAVQKAVGFDDSQRIPLTDEVTRGLFSPDADFAVRMTGRMLWSLEQRRNSIEQSRSRFSTVPRHIGEASVSFAATR